MAKQEFSPLIPWAYDLLLWIFSILVDLFFREVHPRGSWKIPRRGPILFVAAPHANQFVDPLILMRTIRLEAHRRIAILIAEKSMRRKFIGAMARLLGAVPVSRALDMVKRGEGKIYLPDPVHDPTLVRGVGTKFDSPDVQAGGLLVLPSVNGTAANAEILEIHGPEEIRLKKPFKGKVAMEQLTGRDDIDDDGRIVNGVDGTARIKGDFEGTSYKIAPKVDQTKVYDAVFHRLNQGECVGIFPEGGSHDRTELLPLKAGVAIMALGALAANPDCGLKIVPCGMNYFHAHKFRSRAVIEFGTPLEVPDELVKLYKKGERREAVARLIETVYQALVAVTVTSPDYDTLMLIQAARRLYRPSGKKLPLPLVVELNRRLVKGYTYYKDDPRIKHLKESVNDYNKQLRLLNLRDHQVEYAKFSIPKVIFTLIYRLGKVAVLAIGTLPGLFLFAPVFVAAKVISIKKSREALAASTVKVQGRDVMATWKVLISMALAPLLYTFYGICFTLLTYKNRIWGRIPEWVPLWAFILAELIIFPSITFAALRFGEVGMDIFKSLRPLVLSLNPTSANTLVRLREQRKTVSAEVSDLINTLGPEMFPDFDHTRIIADPFRDAPSGSTSSPRTPTSLNTRLDYSYSADHFSAGDHSPGTPQSPVPHGASIGGASSAQGHMPRNDSFGNLGNIGLFATRPPSRSRSRSNSAGGNGGGASAGLPIKAFSTLDSKEGFDEVSLKIRGAMKERGMERTSRRKSGEWGSLSTERSTTSTEDSGSGLVTPGTGEGYSASSEEGGRKDV
ncbi:MAG: hypothetical protein M1816_001716 [Peltula sp. TS41687]|nr:MAG: hypothetical protein M1816_001716 [Peltula sp. TS41687]